MNSRTSKFTRKTSETDIIVTVNLDGDGTSDCRTGIGFFDHMLSALSKHSRIDIGLLCRGDPEVDDHHTVEDCALGIGTAIDMALGERRGFERFGHAYAPLDESLARAVVDMSGRQCCVVELNLVRERIGELSCENLPHFFRSLATSMKAAIHVDVLRGENDHHKAEAAFKALALALRSALARSSTDQIPSTKGSL